MFIKNQSFKNEETLLEILFDFELGTPSAIIDEKRQQIEEDLKDNAAYNDYLASLTDEEEKMEVAVEERYIRLAELLMEDFENFTVVQQKLYGIKDVERTLLYEINL